MIFLCRKGLESHADCPLQSACVSRDRRQGHSNTLLINYLDDEWMDFQLVIVYYSLMQINQHA